MRRAIAVVTGSRAEYGILRPVIAALRARRSVDVGVIVTGVHLARRFGRTARDIEADGVPIWATVPMYREIGSGFEGLPAALARAVAGIDRAFARREPAIAVVLGDRLEALAGALAAVYRRIPLAHIHGGETTDLHIDDATRHAITRLAHMHFPATRASAERLRLMGEEPFRIRRCGAPGLDAIRELVVPPKDEVLRGLGLAPGRRLALFLFHPETEGWKRAGRQAAMILDALDRRGDLQILALYPNGDPGSDEIIRTLTRAERRGVRVERHLARDDFLRALSVADVLAGNSSCGLIEASFTGTPVLHAGERNRGREHGPNALFVSIEQAVLDRGLRRALSPRFRARARRAPCPWGDGTAGRKIAAVLATASLDEKLIAKRLAGPPSRPRSV